MAKNKKTYSATKKLFAEKKKYEMFFHAFGNKEGTILDIIIIESLI